MAPTLISRCTCGTNSIPLDIPLPLHAYICHCTSCRLRSGSMYVLNTFLRGGIPFTRDSPPEGLQVYTPTPDPDSQKDGSLFFCKKCSSLLFMCFAMGVNPETGEKILGWAAVVACLSLHPDNEEYKGKKMDDVVQLGMQFCVNDTVDGGACPWTITPGQQKVLKGGPRNQDDVLSPEELNSMEKASRAIHFKNAELNKASTELTGHCYCKAVTISIKRQSPSDKFRGSHCACDTCRLYSGVDVMSFVHFPPETITVNGKPWETSNIDPSIKVYESSSKAFRGSCATCGTSIFWIGRERKPPMVEFAAGIFGTEGEGIRHEDWIDWRMSDAKVSHAGDSVEQGRSKILVEGFKERYGKWKEGVVA